MVSSNAQFTAKERDSETGLDYFGVRYYGSSMGRWLSPDWSAEPVPVPFADFSDPQSLNLYGYVRNSPITRFDADGHEQLIYQDGTFKSPLDPTVRRLPMTKTEAQIEIGIIEIAAAIPTAGASLEAAAAEKALEAAFSILATSGLAVSGSTRIIGAAAGANPEEVAAAAENVMTVTNRVGLPVTVGTGGNLKAGGIASDASSAAMLVKKPSEAIKNPADTALTVKNVVQDLKEAVQSIKIFVAPAPPSNTIPAPAPPPCALQKGGC